MKVPIACLLLMFFAGCDCSRPAVTHPRPPADAPSEAAEKPVLKSPSNVFTFEFSNLMDFPDDNPPKPGLAYVKIIKKDPVAGRVEWRKIQKEGERLGWSEDEDGPTSMHWVFSEKQGKRVKVDFDTKTLLKKIVVDKLVLYEARHCPIPERPLQECPGPTVVKSSYKVNEALIQLESGKTVVYTKLAGPSPVADALCRAHGGKGELEEKVRKQDSDSLFWEAEDAWLSKNPKVRARARDSYRRLLRQFPEETVVTKNLDRIKARAEADIED